MASEKRIEANKKNAQQSTGPRTEEGKAKVRLNAVKHGFRAEIVEVVPPEKLQIFDECMQEWVNRYPPRDAAQALLVRRAAVMAWKLDHLDFCEMERMFPGTAETITPLLNECTVDSGHEEGRSVLESKRPAFDASGEGERMRRYELSLHRALMKLVDVLNKLHPENRSESSAAEGPEIKADRPALPLIPSAPNKPITAAPNKPITAAPNKPNGWEPSSKSVGVVGTAPTKPVTTTPTEPIAAAPSKLNIVAPNKPNEWEPVGKGGGSADRAPNKPNLAAPPQPDRSALPARRDGRHRNAPNKPKSDRARRELARFEAELDRRESRLFSWLDVSTSRL